MGLSITVLTQVLDVALHWFPSVRLFLIGVPPHAYGVSSLTLGLFLLGSCLLVGGYIRLVFGVLSRTASARRMSFLRATWSATASPAGVGARSDLRCQRSCRRRLASGCLTANTCRTRSWRAGLHRRPGKGRGSQRHFLHQAQLEAWEHRRSVWRSSRLAAHPRLEPQQQLYWLVLKVILMAVLTCLFAGLWWAGAQPLLAW